MNQVLSTKEGTTYHKYIESKFCFLYQTFLGKIIYDYMTYRPDIGYVVTTLSKISRAPSAYKHGLLKQVKLCL